MEPRPYERRVKNSILIDHAMKLHKGPTNCVLQAGGHVGVWPNRLTEYFDQVFTFEPHPDNYKELIKNIKVKDQIIAFEWALGGSVGVKNLKSSTKSTGMHHIDINGDKTVHVTSIDWFCNEYNIIPNAIFLDIEGYELLALMGGEETISKHKPLISCEENAACLRYGIKHGELAEWLAKFGYKLGRKYKKDLIFCPS